MHFQVEETSNVAEIKSCLKIIFKYLSVIEKSFLGYPSDAATTAAFNFLEKRKNKFGHFRK